MKLGSVEADLLCVVIEDSVGGSLICIDDGRLVASSPLDLRLGGCIGKEKSGLATISIRGPPGSVRTPVLLLICLAW